MSRHPQRLNRLEGDLTPAERVRAWLAEAQRYPTINAYAASLIGQPEEAFPLCRLPQEIERTVRGQLKGRPRREVEERVRVEVREAAFLIYLALKVNEHVLAERRLHWLHLAYVGACLRPARLGLETWDISEVQRWRAKATALATEIFGLAEVVDRLAARYFGGTMPLFPAATQELYTLRHQVEYLVASFNDLLELGQLGPRRQQPRRALRLDFDQLRAQAGDTVASTVAGWVHLAQAEALLMVGEEAAAYARVAPHL
jgi:hypothetical protein